MDNVVKFPGLNLMDVPACLRRLAEQIEEGAHGEVGGLLVVAQQGGDLPAVFGFGPDEQSNFAVVGQLEAAKHWFLIEIAS